MKTLNTVIREMYTKVEESVDLDESTKAYAASLEKMANDKKLKNISKKDRDTLAKLADLMKNANEEVDFDEDALNEAIEAIILTEEEIKIGSYQTKNFSMCPGATTLYKDLEATPEVVRSAKLQDELFTLEKGVIDADEASEEDLEKAKQLAAEIMSIAKDMGKEKEHGYVQGHVDKVQELVKEELEEDYFKVQYFGKDGKPEAGKESNFKDEKSAKRYLARAQKAVKVGEYKMTKEKGKLESVEKLDENVGKKVYEKKAGQSVVKVFKYSDGKMFAFFDSKGYGETNMQIKKFDKNVLNKAVKHFDDNKGLIGTSMDSIYESANVFGHKANYGITDSLLDAVNKVVTGEADAVEPEVIDQNEIIENGAEDVCEALVTGVQGKDGKKYSIELQKSGRKVVIRTKNQFGDINTIDLKKAAKIFEQDVIEALNSDDEEKVKEIIGKLKGASKSHADQAKDLEKAVKEDNTNDKSDDGDGLDKVQPKAVKKKFKDRKDKDIDNDGDVDDSDKFLHKKRKAISKAIEKEKSEDKESKKKNKVEIDPKLEEEMTPEQEKKREEIVLKLKEKEDDFKKKYGDRAKEVMYATATKLAMKNTK